VTEPPLLSLLPLVSPVPGSSARPPEAPGSSVPHLRQQQHPTPLHRLETGAEIRINRLCVLGGIVASRQWGACGLCIEHAAAFNNLLEVCTLIQVDSATFASNSHSEELIRFSKVSALPFAHELHFDGINNSLVWAAEHQQTSPSLYSAAQTCTESQSPQKGSH